MKPTRFNYINTDRTTLEHKVDFEKKTNNKDDKIIYRFNDWDKGLRSRTKNFRKNGFNEKRLEFINMNFMGGNDGIGFHKHTQASMYKYRMRRHVEKPDEHELDDENLALEEQATQGGDVMGFRQLDKSKAKALMQFRKKPLNEGDSHGKGYFGAGLLKEKRQEEIDAKNNNKDNYKVEPENEFSSLSVGIKKEKLEYSKSNITQATDGI
jgi:hypothetical protein